MLTLRNANQYDLQNGDSVSDGRKLEKKLDTHQCKNQGPGLSVVKRMVTLSRRLPVETTSLRTGFA